jgi:hypothetical protein
MVIQESDAEISEFDERHREYLVMRELKLGDIVKLAHLVSSAKWSGLKVPSDKSIVVTPHFAALKNEAIYGRIECEHKGRPGAIIDHAAPIAPHRPSADETIRRGAGEFVRFPPLRGRCLSMAWNRWYRYRLGPFSGTHSSSFPIGGYLTMSFR